MKHFNLKKMLMMLALVIIVQNGTIIITNTNGNTGSYTDEGAASPYSDRPYSDDRHS